MEEQEDFQAGHIENKNHPKLITKNYSLVLKKFDGKFSTFKCDPSLILK